MNAEQPEIDELEKRIRGYLREHPSAADTLEGVAVWWLSGSAEGGWLENVRRAIEQLVARGEVARKTMIDGTVIYGRGEDS